MSGTLAEVFSAGYGKFKNYIRASFSSLNDYDAEDIVQQTAMNLLGFEDDDHIGSTTSYIYASLRNGALNLLRKRRHEQLDDAVESAQHEGSAEEAALRKDLQRHMEAALSLLDEKSRFVFVETELNSKSYKELAELTGEPIGTLLSRKNRAVKKLITIMENYDR